VVFIGTILGVFFTGVDSLLCIVWEETLGIQSDLIKKRMSNRYYFYLSNYVPPRLFRVRLCIMIEQIKSEPKMCCKSTPKECRMPKAAEKARKLKFQDKTQRLHWRRVF